MKEHIIILSTSDKEHLGTVRCFPQLRAAVEGARIWLRGISADKELDISLRRLPAKESYVLDTDGLLFPKGGLTPIGNIGNLKWMPLVDFLPIDVPASALPAQVKHREQVQIIPTDKPNKGEGILTDWALWKSYVGTAPQVRLERLRFAASADGKALILGNPLPSIPGKEYWMRGKILLPSGFDFALPLMAQLLPQKLNPTGDTLLIFDKNGAFDQIPLSKIVPANRATVRLTNP